MFTDFSTYRLLADERVQDLRRWSEIRSHRISLRNADRRTRRHRRWL